MRPQSVAFGFSYFPGVANFVFAFPAGNMKMLSISGGTKILPKPSQPVYMVATSTSALSMVTRTIPASEFFFK